MNKLIILTTIWSIVAYEESTRNCDRKTYDIEMFYNTSIKINCSDTQIKEHVDQYTSNSKTLLRYANNIMSNNFGLKSNVRSDNASKYLYNNVTIIIMYVLYRLLHQVITVK